MHNAVRAMLSLGLALVGTFGCASSAEAPATSPPATAAKASALLMAAPPTLKMEQTSELDLILLGDTGEPGPLVDTWRPVVAGMDKDAILVLGDLVYVRAPECPSGTPDAAATKVLDERVGGVVGGLGAPTILALGNHDVDRPGTRRPREECVLAYAATRPEFVMPDRVFVVDWGVAVVVVVDTNNLDIVATAAVQRAFAAFDASGRKGWKIIAGHHVLRTYHDKEQEDVVQPWLEANDLKPDIFLNGHAHLLQFGRYDGVWAITSGTAALPRERPSCPGSCGPGQEWGQSDSGFATLRLTPETFVVSFHPAAGGQPLWTRTVDRSAGDSE